MARRWIPAKGEDGMRLTLEAREEALSRFERATAWPLLIMALAIIPIIVLPLVVDLSSAAQASLTAADWMIWATFAIEYSIRIFLAPRKWHFLKHNVIDTLVVVVPFAQPLRILRSARVLRLTRVARAGTYMARGAEEGRSLFSRENFSYAIAVTLIALGGAALLVWAVERQAPQANIRTLPDAIWWAVSTVSTVGYGDRYPVTAEGRAIAVVLMVLGIALFGVIAATLSSFFVEQQHKGEFAKLMEKIEGLERRLEDMQVASSSARPLDDLPPGSQPESTT
jgi:voltage-gated potassium channel